MIRTLLEIHDNSAVPKDEDPKQVFLLNGDYWVTGHYSQVGGEWIDENGHGLVNVLCWCEMPHPANLTEITLRTFYEVSRTEVTIDEIVRVDSGTVRLGVAMETNSVDEDKDLILK